MIDHLYIHVPFCRSICYYCDFTHIVYSDKSARSWLDALKEESALMKDGRYHTVYIGGGTPSCLPVELMKELFDIIGPHLIEPYEYTVEVNPESLTEDFADLLVSYGVNRISMGLQSSEDGLLKLMGRHHNFDDVKEGIRLLRHKGITNISLDIMYSLPSQTMDHLKNTLDLVMKLDVPHLSLYSLTIEENTVFAKKGYRSLPDDIEADMYEYIVSFLESNGYEHYEISNFCKKGYQSLHNLGYWHYDDFLGLSAGASSKIGSIRYDNPKDFSLYLKRSEGQKTILSKKDMMFENIMMSLRLQEGLDLSLFKQRYGEDLFDVYKGAIKKQKDYLKVENGHLICTNREILNSVLLDFLD